MKGRARRAAAWQNESREFLETAFESIDQGLECEHLGRADTADTGFLSMTGIRGRKGRSEIEERTLDPCERRFELRVDPRSHRHTDRCIRLVDITIGSDSIRILPDSISTKEISLARITTSCIDLHRVPFEARDLFEPTRT